jgi:hypothetical protein
MTANFRKPGLLYPSQTVLTLPSPAPFTTRFHNPSRRATREYRRSLRAAEMAAWEAATPSTDASLKAQTASTASPAEERMFTLLLVLSLAGVVWGLSESARFVEIWQQFVALVRQVIG